MKAIGHPGRTLQNGQKGAEYDRLEGALVALNTLFEAARAGSMGSTLSEGIADLSEPLNLNEYKSRDG